MIPNPKQSDNQKCFGQRQGWCKNLAVWRLEGAHIILHFCDECKNGKAKELAKGGAFIEMEP